MAACSQPVKGGGGEQIKPGFIDLAAIPGMVPHDLADMSHHALYAIGFALKYGWRVEKVGRTIRFQHPRNTDDYKLATADGLRYMALEADWRA